ncbi:MAG: DUF5678 domain-containing protein [Caldilineaceae bacterium]
MLSVALRPELSEPLELDAQELNRSINELVNEAVETYLRARQQEKLNPEIVAYEAMHSQLKTKKTYLGQWVAIHDSQLVDSDADGAALYKRIRGEYGRKAVLIRQVAAEPVEEIWIRTPSTG